MSDFEMTEEEFYESERMEAQKHDDKLKELREQKELEETLKHREHCIDWIQEHHPEVISEYLERK